jgi:hypothetical protein
MIPLYQRLQALTHGLNAHDSVVVSVEEATALLATRDELTALKKDAYLMRYHLHQQGLHDWLPEQREQMEAILYEDGQLKNNGGE